MSTINVRADKKLKNEANKILKALGMDMSSAIKVFLKQVVITKSIPFQLKTENGFTIAQEKQLLAESAQIGKKRKFDNAEDLHESILNEKEV